MDLVFPVRILAFLLCLTAAVLVGCGWGGVSGERCAAAPPQRLAASAVNATTATPASKCDKKHVDLARYYFTIDNLFFFTPPVDGAGSIRYARFRLSQHKYRGMLRFHLVPVGQHNILYVNTLGIKVAFVLSLINTLMAGTLVLMAKFLVAGSHPHPVELERVVLGASIGLNAVAGSLALVWGLFAHLSQDQKGKLEGLSCLGWTTGGISLLVSFLLQVADLLLSLFLPPPTPLTESTQEETEYEEVEVDGVTSLVPKPKTKRHGAKGGLSLFQSMRSMRWKSAREPDLPASAFGPASIAPVSYFTDYRRDPRRRRRRSRSRSRSRSPTTRSRSRSRSRSRRR